MLVAGARSHATAVFDGRARRRLYFWGWATYWACLRVAYMWPACGAVPPAVSAPRVS